MAPFGRGQGEPAGLAKGLQALVEGGPAHVRQGFPQLDQGNEVMPAAGLVQAVECFLEALAEVGRSLACTCGRARSGEQ